MKTMQTLGFILDEVEDCGYAFKFEGKTLLWVPSEDEAFFSIAFPAILDCDDVDEEVYYKIIDKFNATVKYVKANDYQEMVWLFYERELIGDENLEEIIPRMIIHLERASRFFYKNNLKKVIEELNESDDEDDDAEEETRDLNEVNDNSNE